MVRARPWYGQFREHVLKCAVRNVELARSDSHARIQTSKRCPSFSVCFYSMATTEYYHQSFIEDHFHFSTKPTVLVPGIASSRNRYAGSSAYPRTMESPVMITDRSWTYPIVVGLGSIPFTLLAQWLSAGTLVLLPVLLAGLLVGYIFAEQRTSSRSVGWRAGLVGGLALLWGGVHFITMIPEHPFSLAAAGFAFLSSAIVIGLYIVIFGVVGGIGGILGEWMADRVDGLQPLSLVN